MNYVDLMITVAVIASVYAVAYAFWKWFVASPHKEVVNFDYVSDHVSESSDERLRKLERFADSDQLMKEQILTLSRMIGKRYCIKRLEEFTSYSHSRSSYTHTYVWGDDYSLRSEAASEILDKIQEESKDTFRLTRVFIHGRETLVTTNVQVREDGQFTETYWIEEVKI